MSNKIVIVGAGLVGSLQALMLRQLGFEVSVYEKRDDPRNANMAAGRSINLALSYRGIRPLKETGVFEKIEPLLIPMKGRMMHAVDGELTVQPYGQEGQHINSISRAKLNEVLIQESEAKGVSFQFEKLCKSIDFDSKSISFNDDEKVNGDLILGCDGAFSAVRKKMQTEDRFNYSQHYIEHGYKELSIPPINDEFALDPNYLHIWPRGNFMLIALPNTDKSFTCTLFFPFQGELSFQKLGTEQAVMDFFEEYFEDTVDHIENLTAQFFKNPTSSLVTVRCEPWNKNSTMILGDAAHAIVPFYGQGMNSGFEDARLFTEMAKELNFDWPSVVTKYATSRKKDADAISELALHNFIEMRDHVGDPSFLKRKKIEAQLQNNYPNQWIPLYSMVTFSDIPYSEALRIGKIQTEIIEGHLDSEEVNLQAIINEFDRRVV